MKEDSVFKTMVRLPNHRRSVGSSFDFNARTMNSKLGNRADGVVIRQSIYKEREAAGENRVG